MRAAIGISHSLNIAKINTSETFLGVIAGRVRDFAHTYRYLSRQTRRELLYSNRRRVAV